MEERISLEAQKGNDSFLWIWTDHRNGEEWELLVPSKGYAVSCKILINIHKRNYLHMEVVSLVMQLFCPMQVQQCYEISGMYSNQGDLQKLEELGEVLNNLDAGDSIVVASSFSHMLQLGNLAEEVQIAYRRRVKAAKRGDLGDENSALTESDLEETFRRLVNQLGKSPAEIFDALKKQTVDLVFTAHPTQSIRRSLLQKHTR